MNFLAPLIVNQDMDTITHSSRAVARPIPPGSTSVCQHCDEPIKFKAAATSRRIIANVYVNERWDRVEIYHPDCYSMAGEPYGRASTN